MNPSVVIGVGNVNRRDRGVGPAVVRRLRARGLAGATLVESDGEAAALIALWDSRRFAVLVDAVCADPPHPGRVHRLVVPHPAAERARAATSHGMDLGNAVELARQWDRLPARLVVFAIEASETGPGRGLTPAVEAAAARVADEIATEVAAEVAVQQRSPAGDRVEAA